MNALVSTAHSSYSPCPGDTHSYNQCGFLIHHQVHSRPEPFKSLGMDDGWVLGDLANL